MIKLGDSHNGNSVSLIQRGESKFIFKPRCVFWENLFLNSQSSFREFCRNKTNLQLDPILGDIKYQVFNNFNSGEASYVNLNENFVDQISVIAELAATSMVFGFGDLHSTNFVKAEDNFIQIVDLECVFNDYKLLQSSLISPAKWNASYSKTLLGDFCKRQNNKLSFDQYYEFIVHFCGKIQSFINDRSLILEYFNSINEEIRCYPLRVLLSPTFQYSMALKMGEFNSDFCQEEVVQLRKNDIPYFWGYLGESNIYWGNFQNPELLLSTSKKIDAIKRISFKDPAILINQTRLNKIALNVIAEIANNLLDGSTINNLNDDLRIDLIDEKMRIKFMRLKKEVIFSRILNE